jgi:hypothetical protein
MIDVYAIGILVEKFEKSGKRFSWKGSNKICGTYVCVCVCAQVHTHTCWQQIIKNAQALTNTNRNLFVCNYLGHVL